LPALNLVPSKQQRICSINLKQIGLGLLNYHDRHGCFPPAYFADEQGRPMHSWRVIILRDVEGRDLHEAYRWDEPWNSEYNLELTKNYMPECYACPSDRTLQPGETNYLAVTGPGTAFDGDRSIRERDVDDPLSSTIAVTDVVGMGVHWSDPRDISVDQVVDVMQPNSFWASKSVRPSHRGGTNFLLLDASVHFIQESVPPETLRAMSTIAGGEKVELPF